VASIVPPNRKIRVPLKALRWASVCVLFALLSAVALGVRSTVGADLSFWAQWVGFASAGVAVVAAIGAVIYWIVETPKEITVHDHRNGPPVIHLDRKD
jgi:hypothetical protein